MYHHEIDALNALVKAVERNNELLEQLVQPKVVPVIAPVRPERTQRRAKAK